MHSLYAVEKRSLVHLLQRVHRSCSLAIGRAWQAGPFGISVLDCLLDISIQQRRDHAATLHQHHRAHVLIELTKVGQTKPGPSSVQKLITTSGRAVQTRTYLNKNIWVCREVGDRDIGLAN